MEMEAVNHDRVVPVGADQNGGGSSVAIVPSAPSLSESNGSGQYSDRRSKALKKCREHFFSRSGETLNITSFKEAACHEIFFETLFQLFDEDGDGLLDQDEFLLPFHRHLTDDRGKQFYEVLETATFAIALEQFINLPIFTRLFATKGLLDKLFRLMDKSGSNSVSINEAMDFIAKLTVAQTQTSLTKENLEYLTMLFASHCNGNNEITLENFRKIIRSKNVFFTERVFQIFDRDGSGTVSMQEFLDAVSKFSGQSMDNKIKFLFDIYDLDGDGRVSEIELRQVIKACMDENGMKFSEDQLDDLTTALFEDADPNNTGAITVEALKAQLDKHDGLLDNLSYSIERWLVPPKPVVKTTFQKIKDSKPHQLSWGYVKNNHVFVIFLFLFLAVNVILFGTRVDQYKKENIYVQIARGCGQCLNFTCAFILACMLRKFITWLRALGFSVVLPLDSHIYMHKLTGWLIFMYSAVHTVMHIANLAVLAEKSDDDDVGEFIVEMLFTTKSKIGWIGGSAFPTGVALLVILIVMVVCSQPFVRKYGKFEVFYWTHRLYIAFYILCFVHGPRFWHWLLLPGVLFLIEVIYRLVQRRTGYGRTNIMEAVLLPSKVTHLVIKRPPNFHFQPGDYIFIKVPSIAKYEWHPFTISSAPEQDDVLWLHIRGVGEWTNQLHNQIDKQFRKMIEAQTGVSVDMHADGGNKRKSIFSRGSKYLRNSARLKLRTNGDIRTDTQGYETMQSGVGSMTTLPRQSSDGRLKVPGEKTKVSATKSLPILELKKNRIEQLEHKHLARSTSHQVGGSIRRIELGGGVDPLKVCVRTRSSAQSFRHMRRKPRVLPMPGMSSAIIQEEDEEVEDTAGGAVVDNGGQQELTSLTSQTTIVVEAAEQQQKGEEEDRPVETLVVPSKEAAVAVSTSKQDQLFMMGNSGHIEQKQTTIVCYDPIADEKPLEVIIDGPYGAPSSHIFRAEHAVLIGTGIGVTPFASILQSIMRRYWEARLCCPKCTYSWTSELPSTYLNLRKVDFFWINRDQKSFEWFVNLLSQLEIEQAEYGGAMERFLDMHMYITSALQKTDMKAVGLHLALDLLHEKEKRDMITGLKTRTQAGRPNWNKVFHQITQQKKGKVTVFFCGPPQLARTLKLKCDEFGFAYKKEIF